VLFVEKYSCATLLVRSIVSWQMIAPVDCIFASDIPNPMRSLQYPIFDAKRQRDKPLPETFDEFMIEVLAEQRHALYKEQPQLSLPFVSLVPSCASGARPNPNISKYVNNSRVQKT
jgi:hypothetical protein